MDTEKNATVTTTDEESTVTEDHCWAEDRGEVCFGADENCRPTDVTEDSVETPATAVHYHVGHNDAGYLPESDVATVETWAQARAILVEDMRHAADSLETWAEPHDCDDIPCPTYGDECTWMNAQNLRNEADELEASAKGPEFLTYASGGRSLPVAWWINECSDTDCEIDQ